SRRWDYRFNRAFNYGKLDRWSEAVEDYEVAKTLFPDDYSTAFNLGQALHKAGLERRAAAEYERAISLKDNDPTFYLALATSYERLNQPAEAAAVYQKYLQYWSNTPEAARVKGRLAAIASNGK